jgi:hypothetical protein
MTIYLIVLGYPIDTGNLKTCGSISRVLNDRIITKHMTRQNRHRRRSSSNGSRGIGSEEFRHRSIVLDSIVSGGGRGRGPTLTELLDLGGIGAGIGIVLVVLILDFKT